MLRQFLCIITIVTLSTTFLFAADWTAFRGADGNSKSPDTGLLKKWAEGGPKLLWTADFIGFGYSSVTISGDRIYISGDVEREGKALSMIFCLNREGNKIWEKDNGPANTNSNRYPGTRGTPTVDGDFVYDISVLGEVTCFDAKTGDKIWNRNILKDYAAPQPYWLLSHSLIVDGDNLISLLGGPKHIAIAMNKRTGETVWESPPAAEDAPACYATPYIFEFEGVRVLAAISAISVEGIDTKTGKKLFSIPWVNQRNVHCTMPVYHDGHLFLVTASEGGTAKLFKFAKNDDGTITPTEVWAEARCNSQSGGAILIGDYVYVMTASGSWCAINFMTGEIGTLVRIRGVGTGAIHYADGLIYALAEDNGTVLLVKPEPKEYIELSRFELPNNAEGKTWAHPVVVGGRLYIRHAQYLYCYDVQSQDHESESSQTYNSFENRGVAYSVPNHSFEDGPSAFLIAGSPAPVATNRGYYGNNSIKLTDTQKALWNVQYNEATMGQRKTLSAGVWVYIDGDKGNAGITLECFIGNRYVEVSRTSTDVTKRWFYLKTPFMSAENSGQTVDRVRVGLYSEMADNVFFDFVQLGDWQRFNGNHERMAIMAYQPWYGDKNAPNRWDGWARDATRAGGERYDPNIILNPGTPDAKRHIASVYYPLIGAYKSNDTEVLEYHVQIIKAMGFDVIQVNYYADRTPYQKEVLEILFDIALRYDMKMSVLYEPKIHWNDRTPPDQRVPAVANDIINFIDKYKDHKALLQYNGRPLIGSFDYNNLTDSDWGTIIERVKNETGYTIAVSSQTINLRSSPNTEGVSTDNIESAFIWSLWTERLNTWNESNARNFTESLQTLVINWNRRNNFCKLPMGMIFPGFDDTPIRAWAQTPPGTIRKVAGTGPQFYHVSWDSFMKHKDQLDWINVATFNDWNEGTILEPSKELGHELAFITAQRMAVWKGKTGYTRAQLEAVTDQYLKTRTVKYD